MIKKNKNRYLIATLTFFIIPLTGLGVDIYVPSLPAISQYFHVSKSLSQLSITSYMIGLGIFQLFAGSISDSFGRRKPYLISMLIFIIAIFLVTLSKSIHQLLFLRFIQGSAIALTVVPMRSVILDLFEGRELQKMTTYMTLTWSIGPIIAPVIGGYLQHYFGWQYCFYFLFMYSFIIYILSIMYLPETSKHKHPFRLGHMIQRYFTILYHVRFAIGVLINGILYSLILVFSVIGPFLVQNVLHFTPIAYGKISLLMGFAWFMGVMTNHFLIDISLEVKNKFCLWSMLLICLFLLYLSLSYPINIYYIVLPLIILLWLDGILLPNYFARLVGLFPKMTASANALFGSITFLVGGISSGIVSLLRSNTAVPLSCSILVMILICLVLSFVDNRIK